MFSDNTPLGVHENSTSMFFKLVLTKVSIIGNQVLKLKNLGICLPADVSPIKALIFT